ncbi:hypothetical protein ACRQ1B_11680 [Rhizobium panacihumi]|uniref:hypothetical protein n=1 Tax=Rhizobium panacihumi TaxID=2008450 RepID=UPI003D7BD96D
MLLPTQIAASTAITDSMQTILDSIEERRQQEQEKKTGRKDDPLLKARISASSEAKHAQGRIAEALFGMNKIDINELKIQLMDKLGEKLGISREDGTSNYAYGRAIEDALKSIGTAGMGDLGKELGLDELDISLTELVNAIKSPWGEENERLEKALERQHGDGRTTADQRAKILQRLDDASDPKTLEELKLGPQYSDPSRVVDEETRAEELEDIKAREAAEKLDDVKDVQDIMKKRLREDSERSDGERNPDNMESSDDLLLLSLTAETEIGEQAEDISVNERETSEEAGTITDIATNVSDATHEEDVETLEKLTIGKDDTASDAQTLSARMLVDDIGLYDILKRRHTM